MLAENPKCINHLRGRDRFVIFNTCQMSNTREGERERSLKVFASTKRLQPCLLRDSRFHRGLRGFEGR